MVQNRDPNNGLAAVPFSRTGMPEPKLYVWNAAGEARAAEAEAYLAAIRAVINEANDRTEGNH